MRSASAMRPLRAILSVSISVDESHRVLVRRFHINLHASRLQPAIGAGLVMSLLVFGGILLFAIPIISIAALVMTLNIRDQVRQLERRINELGTRAPESPVSTAAPAAATPAEPAAPADEQTGPAPKPAAAAPPPIAPAPATSTTLEEKIRYTVGRLDRRPGAGAWRHLSRALHHRAGPARPRRAHFPRRSLFRIADRGRRMGASQRNCRRHRCHPEAAHSEHSHRCGYDCRICDRLCCICTLWFSVAGRRFRPARPRGSGHIGSSIAAWACACRSRHRRSLHYTVACLFGEPELLGA